MKRRLLKLGVFVVAGVIVNVAVAWGCTIGSHADEVPLMGEEPARCMKRYFDFDASAFDYTDIQGAAAPGFGLKLTRVQLSQMNRGDKWVKQTIVFITEAGWPVPALHAAAGGGADGLVKTNAIAIPETLRFRSDNVRLLATQPIWPGFAINTIFYAAILWLLLAAPGAMRRSVRRRRGQCPACAYPVGASAVCSECGKPVKATSVEPVA